jgi:seryl-tRNA synthetase
VIDLRLVRDTPERVRAALRRRGGGQEEAIDRLLALDERRRAVIREAEQGRAERNRASEEVARLKRSGGDAAELIARLKSVSDAVKAQDDDLRAIEAELEDALLRLPNLPLDDVPEGDARANVVVRTWGEAPAFEFAPRTHWELGERLGILDLPRGAKLSGSGFPLFVGEGARLVRALVSFMLDLHTREHGYLEVAPPYLVLPETARGTGQLPALGDDMYVTTDGLYLIPTAEVPVTNLHRDEVLSPGSLPRAYVASTPCFRREAGAHGKDTRGLIRVHQFDKVELVRFSAAGDSTAELETILGHAEAVLRRLGIPYRVVLLAAGDLGFASAKTYDLEVWAPGVGAWLEASSASTFTDFQARRANIRHRPRADAKPELVHTLNASGVALPRTLIALLENYQAADGSVQLPDALVPFFGRTRLGPPGRA